MVCWCLDFRSLLRTTDPLTQLMLDFYGDPQIPYTTHLFTQTYRFLYQYSYIPSPHTNITFKHSTHKYTSDTYHSQIRTPKHITQPLSPQKCTLYMHKYAYIQISCMNICIGTSVQVFTHARIYLPAQAHIYADIVENDKNSFLIHSLQCIYMCM